MKKEEKLIGAGVLSAVTASLCCITPVLALISGTSGIAATFSWLEPFRPYLIGFTVFVLGFAWYQKINPKKEMDCNCETDEKPTFLKSQLFLGIVTLFAIVMTAFPYYSGVFYQKHKKETIGSNKATLQTLNLGVAGMTCSACEAHINHAVQQLSGVLNVNSSYENGTSEIKFDNSKTTIEAIEKAVNSTGYSVINKKKN